MRAMIKRTNEMVDHFQRIEKWIAGQGDSIYSGRMREILAQLTADSPAMTVAFCGLFSAGKSSLINALCQVDDLATGAVPTTSDVAVVVLPATQDRVQLLDTPGVDSTDETHREATMNALHRADVMVLVADYQHVEAEENLELLRAFTDEGKRLLFVVNQVDKHLDFELPFVSFQTHVEEALDDYGIVVERIFYTSTTSSPYNQLDDLRAWLTALGDTDEEARLEQVKKRLTDLVREAVAGQYAKRRDEALDAVAREMGQRPLDTAEARAWLSAEETRHQQLNEQLQAAYQKTVEARNELRERWIRVVELAQIAPYETTEKGRLYVESLRPDFKVGVLFAAKKTKAEQTARAERFLQDLNERIDNYLVTPLTNQIAQDVRQSDWGKDEWLGDLSQIQLTVDEDYVHRLVKSGALVSSQYPYQYVKDVVSRVKRDVSAQLTTLVDGWFAAAKADFFAAQQELQAQIDTAHRRARSLEMYLSVCADEQTTIDQLLAGEVPVTS